MASGSSSVKRCVMAVDPRHGPTCHGGAVVKEGKTSDGQPRLRCDNPACTCVTFIQNST